MKSEAHLKSTRLLSISMKFTLQETTELTTRTLFGSQQSNHSSHRGQQERSFNNRPIFNQRAKPKCLCGGAHPPQHCNRFSSPVERRAEARRQGVCWRCFNNGHNSKMCPTVGKCPKCNEDHHSSLCTGTGNRQPTANPSIQRNGLSSTTHSQPPSRRTIPMENNSFKLIARENHQPRGNSRVQTLSNTTPQGSITAEPNQPALQQHVLQIASAQIFSESDMDYQSITILMDSGAQRSFIKSSLRASLKLPTVQSTSFTTVGMGELRESFKSDEVRITLKSCHSLKKLRRVPVFTKGKLTTATKTAILSEEDQKFIKGKKIVIAQQNLLPKEVMPDILIGQDILHHILDHSSAIRLPSGLILTPTIFGYTISGTSGRSEPTQKSSDSQCSSLIVATSLTSSKYDCKTDIENLSDRNQPPILELLGRNTHSGTDEASVIKFTEDYRKTITIENGTIAAGTPFSEEVRNLENNLNVAINEENICLHSEYDARCYHETTNIKAKTNSQDNKLIRSIQECSIIASPTRDFCNSISRDGVAFS